MTERGTPAARRPPPAVDQGFTLTELLVVMIVIGILAAIAIPVMLGAVNRAHDTKAKSMARNALTAEVDFVLHNPVQGYMDLWQNSAQRQQIMAEIEGSTSWYNGWTGSSPAVTQVMVRAGHINSGSLVDDWLMVTVLSRSGDCLTVAREDTPPRNAAELVIGTYYWRGPSVAGACPATPNGNLPPSVAPTGPATPTAWGTSW